MVWDGVSSRVRRCASAVGELAGNRLLMSTQGGMNRSPQGLFRGGDRSLREVGLESEEIRTYNEAVDDAEAASLGRARLADGRRIELSVEELAWLVGAEATGERGTGRPMDSVRRSTSRPAAAGSSSGRRPRPAGMEGTV